MSVGFRLGFDYSHHHLRSVLRNHPSARANSGVVDTYIAAEVTLGRLIGPVSQAGVHSSPLGLVPKAHQNNKWRMITDLSCPHGCSVNDGISPDLCSIQYASVDEAVNIVLSMGCHTKLVKIDLRDAYRIVPVHPGDQHLLGITWQGATYVDRCLPFGLRSAPKIFLVVSDALAWAFRSSGIFSQIHYLDDFLFFGRPNSDEAELVLSRVLDICQVLGVPVAGHKTEGPATCVKFLGILVDTARLELRLPREKLERLQSLVIAWVHRSSCTRNHFSAIYHMQHRLSGRAVCFCMNYFGCWVRQGLRTTT